MIHTAARFIALAIGFVLTFPIHFAGGQTRPAGPPESRYEKDRYAREWREIDSLVAEGLPQPALRKVDALLARARRERNAPGLGRQQVHRKGEHLPTQAGRGGRSSRLLFSARTHQLAFAGFSDQWLRFPV